ncbi:MAG TPA: DUF1517 domain-containing protein [Polyangia bacterium]|nr:DUF1517 domain-containing protein [Polyangia bacterium]
MKAPRRARWIVVLFALLAIVFLPLVAVAGPRSGGSFGGRLGFRSGGGFGSGSGYSGGYSSGGYGRSYYGGGNTYVYGSPFGYGHWGWAPWGWGGGFGGIGTLFVLAVAGIAVLSVMRAVRRAAYRGGAWSDDDGYVREVDTGRAYLYRLQLALGRSGRGVQQRLAEFAERGDTSTEAGLAALLQQTALELLREKDAVRYVGADGRGPMSLTNAETTMNSLALAERSRFQVERVRASEGRVNASTVAAEEGNEALELVVVTVVAATRTPLGNFKSVTSLEELEALLSELGATPPDGLLGLEVIWTPADENDSLTEMDVMTTYPDLRGI